MTDYKPPLHNGETRRKAAAWDWIIRIGSIGVWPTLIGLVGYIAWHDDSHDHIEAFINTGDRFTNLDAVRLENRIKSYIEDRYPNNVRYDYLLEKINELQGDIKDLSTYVREQHR